MKENSFEKCNNLSLAKKAYSTLNYEDRVKFDEWKQYTSMSLDNARERIVKLLLKQELYKALDVAITIISKTDKRFFAVEIHFFLIDVIDKFYAMREVNEKSVDICLGLCGLDMDFLPNYIEETGRSDFYAISPTRSAIILEKRGEIQKAIEVCNKAIKLGVLDSNKRSFKERKQKLEKKLKDKREKEKKKR